MCLQYNSHTRLHPLLRCMCLQNNFYRHSQMSTRQLCYMSLQYNLYRSSDPPCCYICLQYNFCMPLNQFLIYIHLHRTVYMPSLCTQRSNYRNYCPHSRQYSQDMQNKSSMSQLRAQSSMYLHHIVCKPLSRSWISTYPYHKVCTLHHHHP
jgi:hypothetical protein